MRTFAETSASGSKSTLVTFSSDAVLCPAEPGEWKKLQAWIVRRKLGLATATRREFDREIAKIFREVYPLHPFTTSPAWKP